jgi:hypothetical protein
LIWIFYHSSSLLELAANFKPSGQLLSLISAFARFASLHAGDLTDVVHHAIQMPLRIHLNLAPQRKAI